MRTALVFLLFFSALPLAFSFAWVAPLLYITMSVLNPHKLTYGAAQFFPFAQIAALASIFFLAMSKDRRWLPNHPLVYLLASLYVWMGITSLASINPEERVWTQWTEVSKTYLMVFVVSLLIYEKRSIQALVLVLAGSIAFYGFKGGLFTIVTGGGERVWGAPGSVINGNNEIGLGIVMIVPFLAYYYGISRSLLGRMAIALLIALCFVAVLGTQSRGAAVALGAMAFFLSAKSKRPFIAISSLIIAGILAFALMPDSWTDRMMTMKKHEADGSAMSRITTWKMILNLAADRPITGAGFALDNMQVYLKYHENYVIGDIPYGPHSIYFQALGEHGYVGFFLYVSLLAVTWWTFGTLGKKFRALETEQWAAQLCRMAQVGLLGFCTGGAFLGLMHWDLPFYLIALCIILVRYAKQFEDQVTKLSPSEVPIGMRYSRDSGYS